MSIPTLFEICDPRPDVLAGAIAESSFAADLASVIRKTAPPDYLDPVRFFANTHPTQGLQELLTCICQRLQGTNTQIGSIFRLDTNFGGGKTHALIALYHAVRGMAGVNNISEFIDPTLLPTGTVRVAAFDGENADPTNGRFLEEGIYAKTPWGEIAYNLAGRAGYERIKASDEQGIAPGAETIQELFGNEPTLILLDELSIYLRKLDGKLKARDQASNQLTAFLTGLFKAVESSPNAALVFTLAIGKEGKAIDAYADENRMIATKMDEYKSVAARKATVLDPTAEDETVKVLRRRLFGRIDDTQAESVIQAYKQLWEQNRGGISQTSDLDKRLDAFRQGYPLHPELIETLRNKTSTLNNFQRVRGMLRFLARTVAQLWREKPQATHAIHLHHLDPGEENIRREITTKLELKEYLPAIRSDVATVGEEEPALAEELDQAHYRGLHPYATYVARTTLFHSLAFNEQLKGATTDQLRYSILAPGLDLSFIDDAVRRFVQNSAYLDDRPNAPLRFLAEANLTQMIRRREQLIDPGEIRTQLNDQIRQIFSQGNTLEAVCFPAGPYDIDDNENNGKPYLVVIGYEAETIQSYSIQIPELVERIYCNKGNSGDLRINRNNLVFLCADSDKAEEMRQKMSRHLALRELKRPETLSQLAEHQQAKLNELEQKSKTEVTTAIQQAYRYLFYPSRAKLDGAGVDLNYVAIEVQDASDRPGQGQGYVIRKLRETQAKLRLPEDQPDSPTYIRDRTPLRRGQISTATLRQEFYRDPNLPILVGDQVFIKGLVQGIEAGVFVYRSGELIWGPGQPAASIKIDENSYIYTLEFAKENRIWPIQVPEILDITIPSPTPQTTTTSTSGLDISLISDPIPQDTQIFTAEGPLRQALTQVWEQARTAKVSGISQLRILLFNADDAFILLSLIRVVRGVTVKINLDGDYETSAGSALEFKFEGELEDAFRVKDFLQPQIRAAADKNLEATYTVNFNEALDLTHNAPETLAEQLCKQGNGSAHVTAQAEANG
ncbi:DUF499 domain-containing protein [Candidatus Synechococcus calcipolaris G9]|uniref:DUF499 domain-containing protein n=1 Tax=Candidatus Synechococcus calcipolaris G9 TaxID=1497997 RepID=A0ABT6F1N5_9SYNE|nr:DUF499 domain-containing protein [Candidatus Synechococcus calcipolaris]MDG2991733.1 DUF499 domain-containing protein [Candidatus Synechococcus calcipolaris G9]